MDFKAPKFIEIKAELTSQTSAPAEMGDYVFVTAPEGSDEFTAKLPANFIKMPVLALTQLAARLTKLGRRIVASGIYSKPSPGVKITVTNTRTCPASPSASREISIGQPTGLAEAFDEVNELHHRHHRHCHRAWECDSDGCRWVLICE